MDYDMMKQFRQIKITAVTEHPLKGVFSIAKSGFEGDQTGRMLN